MSSFVQIVSLTLSGRRLDLQPPTVEVDLMAEQRSLALSLSQRLVLELQTEVRGQEVGPPETLSPELETPRVTHEQKQGAKEISQHGSRSSLD